VQGNPRGCRTRWRLGPTRRRCSSARRAWPGSTWTKRLEHIAASLGADVPFCLRGRGPMRVRGIGDEAGASHASFVRGRDRDADVRLRDRGGVTARGTRSVDRWGRPSTSTASRRCATTWNAPRTRFEPRLAAFKVLVEHGSGPRRRSSRAVARRMRCCSGPAQRPRRREGASPTWWRSGRGRPHGRSRGQHRVVTRCPVTCLLAPRPARLLEKLLCFFLRMRLRRFLIRDPMAGVHAIRRPGDPIRTASSDRS